MTYKPNYKFIPPLNFDWLTPAYDFLCSITGLGKSFKKKILDIGKIEGSQIVVDVGCGTGIFLQIAGEKFPNTEIIGIDPDRRSLQIAKKRTKKFSNIQYIEAFGEKIPLESETVDICFSTLALHHMPDDMKKKTLEEIFRILKKGGKVIITDFGKLKKKIYKYILFFEHIEYLKGNLDGLIPQYMEKAGFKNIKLAGKKFPNIHILTAQKP